MKDLTAKMKFKIPESSTHPDAGKTLEGVEYEYQQCETAEEAGKVAEEKGWTLLDFVNDALKDNARQGKYSSQLAMYAPTEMDQDTIRKNLIRNFIRAGLSEAQAVAQVDSVLAATNG